MKKKTYIAPTLKVVNLNCNIHFLQASHENFTNANRSLSRESDDRFDWGTSDDEEYTPTAPQTPW